MGVVVVVLRDRGQDGEALQACLLELDRAGADGVVELVGAALGVALEVAGEQVGPDPEQQLDLVDRLGQEVTRAGGQAVIAALGGRVRGDDEDGQALGAVDEARDRAQHVQAGHAGHVEVQQNEVGALGGADLGDAARIARADDVLVAGLAQQSADHGDVERLVVDDEDPHRGEHASSVVAADAACHGRDQARGEPEFGVPMFLGSTDPTQS